MTIEALKQKQTKKPTAIATATVTSTAITTETATAKDPNLSNSATMHRRLAHQSKIICHREPVYLPEKL